MRLRAMTAVALAAIFVAGCEARSRDAPIPSTTEETASSWDCSHACKYSGQCIPTYVDGLPTCLAGADCHDSVGCLVFGRCVARGGVCVVGSDEHCRSAVMCRRAGVCTADGAECVARADADCRVAEACGVAGQCFASGGKCLALDEADCKSSSLCRSNGWCGVTGGKRCGAVSQAECAASERCRKDGACTWRQEDCVVASDDDCRGAAVCRLHGKCRATKTWLEPECTAGDEAGDRD